MISLWLRKTFNVYDNGLWEGMTDVHSHLLSGVDDGVKTRKEALDLLYYMEEEIKVQRVCITPHTMMDFNNSPMLMLKEKYEEFTSFYNGQIELTLGSEYMLDTYFPIRLSEGLLLLGEWNGKKLLLVEGSCNYLLPSFYETLEKCFENGYTPVLAHPERYPYLTYSDCLKMKERGCLFQLNIPSLHGAYGQGIRKTSFDLLDGDMYDFAGFDIHWYEGYVRVVRHLRLPRKRLDKLCVLLENNKAIRFS